MKKDHRIKIIMTILALLLITAGVSYSYFSAQITGNEDSTTITVTGGTMHITFDGGATITASNVYPKSEPIATKTFTVTGTNTSDVLMDYWIVLVIETNTFSDGALVFTLDGTNTSNNGQTVADVTLTNPDIIYNGSDYYYIGEGNFATGSNNVHTYTLNIYFPDTGENQNEDQGKTFTAYMGLDNDKVYSLPSGEPDGWSSATSGTLLNSLKTSNTVTLPETIPGRAKSVSDEAELSSTYDDYGVSYYFRGAVQNNYVVFANMCWRIVRVTGSGAIKLVLYNYNASSVTNPCSSTYDSANAAFARYSGTIFTSVFNSKSNDNAYVGYMYGDTTAFTQTQSTTTDAIYMGSSESYYYGTSYTYNSTTKTYTLSGSTISGIWHDIYSDAISTYSYTCKSTSSTDTCSTLYKVDSYYSYNYALTYDYTYGSTSYTQAHANVNKSTILTNLETWYQSTLSSYSSYLADTIWCNNKALSTEDDYLGYGANYTTYSSDQQRYYPSLACSNDENGGNLSKYTVSDTTNGNGDLDYAIGLLTLEEAEYAGLIFDWKTNNTSYYLYNNANGSYWWLMTPIGFGYGYSALADIGYESYGLDATNSAYALAVRPAISLVSSTTVTGTGTSSNPYVVTGY